MDNGPACNLGSFYPEFTFALVINLIVLDNPTGGGLLHPVPPVRHPDRHELLRRRHPRQPRAGRGGQEGEPALNELNLINLD